MELAPDLTNLRFRSGKAHLQRVRRNQPSRLVLPPPPRCLTRQVQQRQAVDSPSVASARQTRPHRLFLVVSASVRRDRLPGGCSGQPRLPPWPLLPRRTRQPKARTKKTSRPRSKSALSSRTMQFIPLGKHENIDRRESYIGTPFFQFFSFIFYSKYTK